MNRVTELPDSADSNILTFEENANEDFHTDLQSPIFLPANDEFDEQVAKAQEQLEDLRRQQEEIEHQKNELEQLRIRQAEFQRGRVEIIENLQHALDVIDRDAFEAEQRVEQYNRAKESFTSHLDTIAHLRPEDWSREELKAELENASQLIGEAGEEYTRVLAHLDALSPEQTVLPQIASPSAPTLDLAANDPIETEFATAATLAADNRSFGYWMRSGMAFTLPLMVFGFFALMLVLLFG